jgi:hypothetical protein
VSRSGEVMARAEQEMAGVRGWLATRLTLERGPTRASVECAVAQLRRAADTLEEMVR